jgi:DNA repair protein RecN (Recombination protein N)
MEWVEARIARLYDLQKKHRASTVEELIALEADFAKRVGDITDGDGNLEILERRLKDAGDALSALAAELTTVRKESAARLRKEITGILVNLGMPMIRFEVDIRDTGDFTPLGRDAVTFLFSANSSSAPQPLSDVASGGEMARVMLALKSLVASGSGRPALVFDEVDTGVSGVLAERMGRLMQQMGTAGNQVLSITHLPQVAALGAHHYKVYKEETEKGTVTNIIKLERQARVGEIAQMMSGELLSDAALENAALLLSQS